MKKLLLLIFLIFLFSNCTNTFQKKLSISSSKNIAQKVILTFERPDKQDLIFLESSDNFDSAILKLENEEYFLRKTISASGMKLKNYDNTIQIHLKGNNGILIFNNFTVPLTKK